MNKVALDYISEDLVARLSKVCQSRNALSGLAQNSFFGQDLDLKGPQNLLVDLVFRGGFCQNISFLSNKSCGFGGYLLPPFMEQACKIVFEPFPYVTTCKYHYYMKKKEIIGIYQLATRQ